MRMRGDVLASRVTAVVGAAALLAVSGPAFAESNDPFHTRPTPRPPSVERWIEAIETIDLNADEPHRPWRAVGVGDLEPSAALSGTSSVSFVIDAPLTEAWLHRLLEASRPGDASLHLPALLARRRADPPEPARTTARLHAANRANMEAPHRASPFERFGRAHEPRIPPGLLSVSPEPPR